MSGELQKIYNSISLPGREEEAKLLVLSLIAKQHCVLIGPPGTAKSLIISTLAKSFNVPYFQYLLTKFTQPEEILGYPNIKMLREQGEYQLITNNRLPSATLAFIDEIFKGSSAILNALLSILNERQFYDGKNMIKCPLWSCLGASNEVPDEPELLALWDRFLFRHWINYVERDIWDDLLLSYWNVHKNNGNNIPIHDFNIIKQAHNAVWKVDVFSVKDKLLTILAQLEDAHGIKVSDRRKGRCLIAMASNAVMNDRNVVIPEDFLVLKYVIPERYEDVKVVEQVITDVVGEELKVRQELTDAINQIQGYFDELEKATEFDDITAILENSKSVRNVIKKYGGYSDLDEYKQLKKLVDEFSKLISKKISGSWLDSVNE